MTTALWHWGQRIGWGQKSAGLGVRFGCESWHHHVLARSLKATLLEFFSPVSYHLPRRLDVGVKGHTLGPLYTAANISPSEVGQHRNEENMVWSPALPTTWTWVSYSSPSSNNDDHTHLKQGWVQYWQALNSRAGYIGVYLCTFDHFINKKVNARNSICCLQHCPDKSEVTWSPTVSARSV